MSERKVKFESNFSLDFGADSQERVYGYAYENFENNILKTQLFYELEIVFKDLGGYHILEIDRREIYINNQINYSQIEKIANTASNALFPVCVKLKRDGQIDKILNLDEIRKRWSVNRKKLLEYYIGEVAEKIISKIDRLFLNDSLLEESIAQNWFFHLFFKPLYINYSEKRSVKHIWKSPIFGNQSIEYGVVQSVKENYTDDDKISVNADGISIDERTIDEILSGYSFSKSKFSESEADFVESKLNVDYKLYKEDRSISSVTGAFETKIDEKTNQRIEIEIYHLTESSSYRPESDEKKKAFQQMFQSWQTAEDDDIIDVSKPKWQVPNAPQPKVVKPPQERIELFVEVVDNVKANLSFWDWIKSIFKKKK
ncbi:hypothetical protein N4T20_17795 [Flavobacterium sp. TR2]|uniref:hypothetical protein n=1 Tax=Flavobacterium sp. TR2 TaxID=2977321 RepID=UPI0021B0FF99|nr:hypothetical protein [Flavobacterium sp. TR2]UWY27572.1 hypothetical protein N4T20_17795 [Flavobacterium sp. TR2]